MEKSKSSEELVHAVSSHKCSGDAHNGEPRSRDARSIAFGTLTIANYRLTGTIQLVIGFFGVTTSADFPWNKGSEMV